MVGVVVLQIFLDFSYINSVYELEHCEHIYLLFLIVSSIGNPKFMVKKYNSIKDFLKIWLMLQFNTEY